MVILSWHDLVTHCFYCLYIFHRQPFALKSMRRGVWSLSEKEKSQDDNISIQWINLETTDQCKAKKPYPWRLNREQQEESDAGTKREKEEKEEKEEKMITIIAPQ
ncbi:hypothetical protein, partial [Vibrio harveyi]|uniref:hypothetical protein n=2 Tax=Vibrio TaxID=662 RepID=UPI00209BC301